MNDESLEINFCVNNDSDIRIDLFLSMLTGFSRSRIQKNILMENLSLDGKIIKKNSFRKLFKGSIIELEIEPLDQISVLPEEMVLNIVFENDHFLIINKNAGIVVHPGAGNFSGTLANGIMHYFKKSSIGNNISNIRPGLVHRIDKDTSGLLVIAKTEQAFEQLAQKFAKHDIEREYFCLVWGKPKKQRDTIETLHGRDPLNRIRFSPNVNNGRKAVTHYEVVSEYKHFSLLKVTLETGRTHQIRMHTSFIGHPIVNDSLYGGLRKSENPVVNKKLKESNRQLLHAGKLGFLFLQKKYSFSSDFPDDMKEIIKTLENISGR